MYISINKKTFLIFCTLIFLTGCDNYSNNQVDTIEHRQTSVVTSQISETTSPLNTEEISLEIPNTSASLTPISVSELNLSSITTQEPIPTPISSQVTQNTTEISSSSIQQISLDASSKLKLLEIYNYYTKENSTIIIWKSSQDTIGYIEYGIDKNYGYVSKKEVMKRRVHAIKLKNLLPSTVYYYKITSQDINGNKVTSQTKTFKTKNSTSTVSTLTPIHTHVHTTEVEIETHASTQTPTTTETTLSENALQKGQVTDSKTGKALGNVKVSIGTHTTITDSNGLYTLSNLPETKEVVVNFEKKGYLIGSTKIELKSLSEKGIVSPNYVEYTLYANDYNYTTEANIDSSRIFVDTQSLINTQGDTYRGAVTINLTILDSSETAFLNSFPGSFKGIDSSGSIVSFTSYGLIDINIQDDKENILRLSGNDITTLVFHVPSSEKDTSIPLWYFDYKKGLWIEDGYAIKQSDGSYKGEITHLGTWSMCKPINEDMGVYTDRILYPDGTPVKNLRIYAIGQNWISADLSTDENGIFKIEVIPGKSFGLQAYHYSDKYAAKFNGVIPALIAGETINKIQ